MEKIFTDYPWVIVLILLWTLPWKGAALWKSARGGHIGWFVTMLVLNTFAILEILYIFVFSKKDDKLHQQQEEIKKEISQGNKMKIM